MNEKSAHLTNERMDEWTYVWAKELINERTY